MNIILTILKVIFVIIPKYTFKTIFWIIKKVWDIFWEIMDVLFVILGGFLKYTALFLLFAFLDNMDDMY